MWKESVIVHNLQDGSGTVLFNVASGETLVLSLPLQLLEQQLSDPHSDILQNAQFVLSLQPYIFLQSDHRNSI